MSRVTFANAANLAVLEEYHRLWQADPMAVDPTWRAFFEGFELALSEGQKSAQPSSASTDKSDAGFHASVARLIDGYRELGHFQAHLDPLNPPPPPTPQLALSEFGLSESDLGRVIDHNVFPGLKAGATLSELIDALKETYCRTIGVEFRHIQDRKIRLWLKERMEPRRNRPNCSRRDQLRILMNLHFAELFERFLHTRYVGQKRFSLEGSETLIAVMDALSEHAPEVGVQEIVIGMAHRGRLNVLANTLNKPYQEIFAEFEDVVLPDSMDGDGDVKYHLGFSSDHTTAQGKVVHLSLTPNPSHLEAVNPVVEGRVRAKQQIFRDTERTRGLPLLIHGDAAFAGQGVVAETLNLAGLAGYTTGGTVHIIVNNQIGFTTSPSDARSTTYCTDVAKMIEAPIFHVNAEDPEAAVYVAKLALDFRQTFHRDVLIDLYCYRKHGHNEGDDPSICHPVIYSKIKDRPSVSVVYTEQLIKTGILDASEGKALDEEFQAKLNQAQLEVKTCPPKKRGMMGFLGRWDKLKGDFNFDPTPTGISEESLRTITQALTTVPTSFTPHKTVARLLEARRNAIMQNKPIDWALAELLAFGSLSLEGIPVRLSGQDSRRGTFSQRHAVLYDAVTGERYLPLNSIWPEQAPFDCYDSLLSEAAVLGFEFGYSLDAPMTLVMWEAQFGDFANGAQTIIDQFLVCSESKWQRSSGLVLLLPHGYEGAGPEHSSARLERFLQACAEENIQVCNLTTPAQYFHVLRRQMKRNFRMPLVIMTPKSLLRHKDAVSSVSDLLTGHFRDVIDDPTTTPDNISRVLMCSGKVYYDLLQKRTELAANNVAIVRIEQLYPWNEGQIRQVLNRYRHCSEWVWVQEESQNMGGWTFVEPRLRAMNCAVEYVGRDASASAATGSHHVHEREQKELVHAAFGAKAPYLVRASAILSQGNKPDVVPVIAPRT